MTKQEIILNNESKDEIIELLNSLYADDNIWKDRTFNLINSIIDLLVYKRNNKNEPITIDLIIKVVNLKYIYETWKIA